MALVMMAGAGAVEAQTSANPLIGRWVPAFIPNDSKGQPTRCASLLIFTPKHQQVFYEGRDNGKGVDVTYNVSAQYVYVIGNTGSAVRYNITGPDTIQYNGYPNCGYKRAQ